MEQINFEKFCLYQTYSRQVDDLFKDTGFVSVTFIRSFGTFCRGLIYHVRDKNISIICFIIALCTKLKNTNISVN